MSVDDRFAHIPSEDEQKSDNDTSNRVALRRSYDGDLVTRDEDTDPNPYISRKNQRRQSWLAMFAMIGLMAALLFFPFSVEKLKVINEPIIWFFFVMGSIVIAYHGATTWFQKNMPRLGGGNARR